MYHPDSQSLPYSATQPHTPADGQETELYSARNFLEPVTSSTPISGYSAHHFYCDCWLIMYNRLSIYLPNDHELSHIAGADPGGGGGGGGWVDGVASHPPCYNCTY